MVEGIREEENKGEGRKMETAKDRRRGFAPKSLPFLKCSCLSGIVGRLPVYTCAVTGKYSLIPNEDRAKKN